MDDTQVNISIPINPRIIERLIYWIVILVLLVLLIIVWARSPSASTKSTTTVQTPSQSAAAVTPPVSKPAASIAASSSSSASCQGTDNNCGGDCIDKCPTGEKCTINADCVSDTCTNGLCTNTAAAAPTPGLSGSMTIKINSVTKQAAPSNNLSYSTYKVSAISYTITNGLSLDQTNLLVNVYVKDKNNIECLNEVSTNAASSCTQPYTTFTIAKVGTGSTISNNPTIQGTYLYDALDDLYDPSDPQKDGFTVVLDVRDATGAEINGQSVSDSYQVNP